MAIYGVLLALMLVMRFAPDSSIGKALNRQLVEVPLRVLGGMRRHHLIFVILLVALMAVGSEAILALGSMDFAVIYALDVSLYVDGLLVTLALASVTRTRSVVALLSANAASLAVRMRRGSGRRASRAPARRAARKPSNDDDHPAFALAA
jgi:hypothetical protein